MFFKNFEYIKVSIKLVLNDSEAFALVYKAFVLVYYSVCTVNDGWQYFSCSQVGSTCQGGQR